VLSYKDQFGIDRQIEFKEGILITKRKNINNVEPFNVEKSKVILVDIFFGNTPVFLEESVNTIPFDELMREEKCDDREDNEK